jgi:hypothetical protein
MMIELLEHSPLPVTAFAIRTCWDSHSKSDNGGEIDRELVNRVGNKFKHRSTLSHLIMNFSFSNFSIETLEEIRENRYINISYQKESIDSKIVANGIMTINMRSILDMLENRESSYPLRDKFLVELCSNHIPNDFRYLIDDTYKSFIDYKGLNIE